MHTLVLLLLAAKAPVAWTDRADWPMPTSSERDFDRASRAEILTFVEAMNAFDEPHAKPEELQALRQWRARRALVLTANFATAMRTCRAEDVLCPARAPTDFAALSAQATPMLDSLPPSFAKWRVSARAFHSTYVRELTRLALLSPRISSEVKLIAAPESNGEEMADRHFLLTFDDGPTGSSGDTDSTLATVRANGLHGIFFLVGDAVHIRKPQTSLYEGQCVGSHGMSHLSHTSSLMVASRLDSWNQELASQFGRVSWFRPPYGQRTVEQSQALGAKGTMTLLWNIDSQDWQAPAERSLVRGRVETLMFLWRRGVLLFHDVHPVAREVLPTLVRDVGEVTWVDCRTITSTAP